MPQKPLRPEVIEKLAAWWPDPSVTIAEMARRLGMPQGNVHRAGVTRWGPRPLADGLPRPWTDEQVEEGRRLVASGLTRKEAAARLGRSYQQLCRILRGCRKGRGRPEDKRDRAVGLLRAGLTPEQVAARLRVSPALARWWRREAGLPEGAEGRGRKIREAFRRRGTHDRNVSKNLAERVGSLDAGWPLCGAAERRVLEALERVGEGTDVDVARAAGYGAGSCPYVGRLLWKCWRAGWATRVRYNRWWRYRLAEAVADRRREFAHAPQN